MEMENPMNYPTPEHKHRVDRFLILWLELGPAHSPAVNHLHRFYGSE